MEKLVPDPFPKNKNLPYLWINCLKFYAVCFYLCQADDYQNILKLSCRPLAFTLFKNFFKNKGKSGTSVPVSFSVWLFKKKLLLLHLYCRAKFLCLVVFISWDIGQYVYCTCLLTRLWRHEFLKLTLLFDSYLSNQTVFLHKQKVKTKI